MKKRHIESLPKSITDLGGDNTQSTGGFGQTAGSTNTFGAPQPSTTNTPVFGVDITPKVEETTKVSVAG